MAGRSCVVDLGHGGLYEVQGGLGGLRSFEEGVHEGRNVGGREALAGDEAAGELFGVAFWCVADANRGCICCLYACLKH